MGSFWVLGKQFCGFLLIENQILNCLIAELTNCGKNVKWGTEYILTFSTLDNCLFKR